MGPDRPRLVMICNEEGDDLNERPSMDQLRGTDEGGARRPASGEARSGAGCQRSVGTDEYDRAAGDSSPAGQQVKGVSLALPARPAEGRGSDPSEG